MHYNELYSSASQSPDPDREGIQSGPSSTYLKRTRITQTSVRHAWHTHTHTGAWTSVAVSKDSFVRQSI